MRDSATGFGGQAAAQIESGNITDSTTIEITTSVKMKKIGADDISQITTTLVEDVSEINFVGYNQGQIQIGDGDSGFIVVNSCRMIQMSSEHPVNITITDAQMATVDILATKRFSYESEDPIRVSVSYTDVSEDLSRPTTKIQYVSTME